MEELLLVIDDEYIIEVGNYCKNRGRSLEGVLVEYVAILEEIRSEAILDGEITCALSDYIGCIKLLRERITSISNNIKTVTKNFATDIDAADAYLF